MRIFSAKFCIFGKNFATKIFDRLKYSENRGLPTSPDASEWVSRIWRPTWHSRSFRRWPLQAKCTKCTYTNNNRTNNLTFTKDLIWNTKHNKLPKPEILRTLHYKRAYVTLMVVLIIFPLIPLTVINLRMLSIRGGAKVVKRGMAPHLRLGPPMPPIWVSQT